MWSGECQLGAAQVQVVGVSTRFRLWECQLGVVRGVSTGCGSGSGSELGSGCGSANWVWSGECQLGAAQVQLWEC